MPKKRTLRDASAFGVSTIKTSGGKRKGRSMKRKPSEVRIGYITKRELVNAPESADVYVDSRGRVHMIEWRESLDS